MNKKNIGSNFSEFLRDEGIYDEVHAAALKEVFAAELRGAMESAGLTEQALAARMGSKGGTPSAVYSTPRTSPPR